MTTMNVTPGWPWNVAIPGFDAAKAAAGIPAFSGLPAFGAAAGGATGVSIGSTPPLVAGSYADPLAEKVKRYTDIFGAETGPFLSWLEDKQAREGDPQRIKEKMEALVPFYEKAAATKQKYGLESLIATSLFKGIPDTIKEYNMAQVYGLANQTNNLAAYQTDRNPSAYSGLRYRIGGGSR